MLLASFVPILIGLALVSSQGANQPGCNIVDNDDDNYACQDIDTFDDLKSQLSSYSDKASPYTLSLSNIKEMPHFPDDVIADFTELMTLKLSHMTLPFWKPPPNRGKKYDKKLDEISRLELDSVTGVHNWNWVEVKEFFGSVDEIRVTNSRWPRLPSHMASFFEKGVKKINFNDCNLKWLDDGSLDCPNCQTIDLSNNDIKDLRGSVFGKGPKKLTVLNLSYNKLTELPTDLFEFMASKDTSTFDFTLYLQGNQITSVNKETFKPFIDRSKWLIHLTINGEHDTFVPNCTCDHKWLLPNPPFDLTGNYCTDSADNSRKDLAEFLKQSCNTP